MPQEALKFKRRLHRGLFYSNLVHVGRFGHESSA